MVQAAEPMEAGLFSFRRLIVSAGLLMLSACASTPSQAPSHGVYGAVDASYARPVYGEWTDEDYHYRIGPGDELALRFDVNPDLNTQVTVGPDGRGVFPLISAVKVEGMTVEEANNALTSAYASALRQPAVETLISTYGAAQIYVGGEVREPGVHPIKGELTVGQAVMTAGGFQPTARSGKVVIIRQRPGDRRLLMRVVDVKDILSSGQDGVGFAVLPGDLVFVPRSRIAEVDLFVQQYITSVLPFSTGVSYNIGNGIIR
jgi:polysaccharide export outer membrane protein